MAKLYSKRYRIISKLIDKNQRYSISEAIDLVKKTSNTKFDSTIEMVMRLNVNPKYSDQQIRGSLILPFGTGKSQKVLVLTTTKENEAIEANADYVGGQNYIDKIKNENWFDFDIIVATPEMMVPLGKIGRILGPKGLMPNPKIGTVTSDIKKAINDIKKGKLIYRVDKTGNLHFLIGKASFEAIELEKNFKAVFEQIKKIKPNSVKGEYIKNVVVSSSMGPGIKINY